MLTVRSEKRANIGDICSHWWVNDGYPETCLEEAEFLASLTPVRLDLLLSLAPGNNESKSEPVDMRPEESVQDPSMSGVSSNEPAMSIVELPLGAEAEVAGSTTESRISISEPPDEENSQHVRRREKEKVKRKLTETPSMLDPDLVHKKRESDGTGDAMLKHDEIPVPMEEEPSTRRGTSQSPVPGGKTVRIRKKKEEPTVERLGVEETHPGYPQISPDLPRKPPPKPKMKEPEISSENQAEMKRRNSRKERNVKTPDPYHHIVPKEEQRPMTPRTHANERPMTPRQGRAPSPEERPLVVPLPPPRVEQITLPPPRPPPRSESPAPPLPPRPKMEQEEGPPKLIVVPLPPPMIVREPPQQMEVVLDDRRKSKFYPDDSSNQHDEPTHIEPVEVKRNLEAPLEDKSPIVIHSNQPPPLPEKKKTKSPQMPRSEKQSQSVQMPSGLEQSEISNHDKPNVAGSAESIEPSIQNQQKLNTRPKILSESQENKFENKIRKSPSKEKEVQPTILFETNKESAPKTPPAKPKDMTSQKYPIEIREEETNLKCKDEPTNYQETLLPPLPQLIGKVTIESNHVPNVMVSLPPISNNAGLLIEQTSKEAKNQSFKEDIKELPKPLLVNQLEQSTIESNTNHLGDLRIGHTATTHEAKVTTPSTNETSKNISQEVDIKNSSYFHEPASVKEQSKPSYIESKSEIEKPMKINEQLHIITSIPSISAEVRSSSPLVKEVALMSPKENSTSKEDIGSPKKDEVNCRSLINSVPKPFKAESPPTNEGNNDSLQREHQSESVRSCSSLSSSGSNQSLSRRPSLQQQNSQQDDLSLISPGSCSLPRPEKRDSKVIKAAQYWNNYIGEVLVKNKPPENPKSLEKPKKIVSAGVGPKGYSDLKNTFEQGGLQRRNSKKLTVDSCLPGLRVTDAKSAFEKKNQPPTPVIYRKNSVVSDTKEKPKWVRPVKVENEQEFPFINKPSDDLKSRAKAKILSEKDTLSDKTFVNGVTNNKDDILKINGSFDRSNENDLNSNELSKQKIKDHNIVIKVQSSNQTPKLNDTTETQQNNVHPKSPKTKAKVLTVKAQETLPIHPTQADSMISQSSVTHRDIQEGKDGSKIETLSTESTKTSKPLELTSKQPDINKKSLTISTKPVTEIENKTIEDAAKKTQTPVLIKEPHTFVTKPVQKEETVKKLKSGLVVIVNNKVRSQPVVINNNLNVVNPGSSSPKAIAKPTIDPKSPPTPPKIIQKAFDPEPTKEESKKSFEAIPKSKEDNKQAIDNVSEGQNNVPVKLKEELVISGKAETPEPSNPIEAAKNALKKVPHAPAMRRKSLESSPVADTGNEETQKDNKTNESLHTPVPTALPATPINDLTSPPIKTVTSIPLQVEPLASHGERVIPIKIEPDSRSRENPSSKREHYIPIVVEGRGTILKTPEPSYIPHEDQEEAERFDTFTTDSLSRRRWGSRKKRFSSAYSDSASVSTEEDLNNESAFAGLQKYTSIGKHGMEEAPMFRLRKTRPPFALQREESFSSGEEDVFNDDGFREMTAENLFSTLLTRVKSLTRRIHDEHEDNPALRWQQNKRIINHPLNPGGTHARLERSALRSSLKRSGPPSSAASTAPSLSRQSSSDASRLSSYARSEDPRASYDDMGSQYRGSGASYLSQQPITSRSSNTAHTSKRPLDNRKLSYELRSNEMDIINKLKREAAERSNDYLGDIDGEFDAMDEMGERLLRKRSGYLSRLDEDDTLLSPSRHLTRRSISRELFGGGGGGSDIDRTSSILSGSSSISGSRPVTRRSISRELFDYSPAGNVSSTGRITPTLGLGTSPARRSTVDYSRSSRERSLGRETSGLSNDFDRSNLDRNRSLGSRRSESLTRGGGNSGLSSGLSTTSSTTTSRPSLSTQGRSLTQNEFIRTSPRSSVSGRLSAGLDEDSSKIRSSALTDRGSALNDRGRADWRRVSVPERGKDYTTLQSKYKRLDPSKHSYQ